MCEKPQCERCCECVTGNRSFPIGWLRMNGGGLCGYVTLIRSIEDKFIG